ncbi:MAG: BamA/TamA family outer membrane protein [Candidatus Latescibacteria bacterium]|nr:BamA/TamA family outer membrane protein [bacterium]MBD3424589.1 BamA/TamA family outer membrane protein [Candidatus Latescibacterota bacterium]
MKRSVICIAALMLITGQSLAEERGEEACPRIGLALSGGGARGAAHIGVLQVLEELSIPVDYIAGTSMGSIVGGFYAAGMSPYELEEVISRVDWDEAFTDHIPRKERSFRRKRDDDLYLIRNRPGISRDGLKLPAGLLDGQYIDMLLKRYTLPVVTISDFDELAVPFRAVAADLETGRARVIGEGDLALAMRASMSIPVVFAPRQVEGRLMVDGGISRNLPVDVVREMGADIVIAVDISSPLLEREGLESVLSVTNQLTNIMTRRNTEEQIGSLTVRDILISPELGEIRTSSFDRAAEAVPIGREAALAAADRLEELSVQDDRYRKYLKSREFKKEVPFIDRIRIINNSRLADRVIFDRVSQETGEYLEVNQLERDLNRIYGLEIFESVYYHITEESGRNVLTITAREASWGPNYLNFGIAIFEDFEGPNFNMAMAYTRTAVNSLSGEWRSGVQIGQEPGIFTELYQPLEHSLRYFLHLRAMADERAWNVFDPEGNKLSEYNIGRLGGELSAGRELGSWGEFRAGLIRETGEFSIQVGDPEIEDRRFERGEIFAQIFIDELDNVIFPHSGGALRIRAVAGREGLGSDLEYQQYSMEGAVAHTVAENTALLSGHFATTGGNNAPLQSLFHLGGFTRLSGLERDELKGQNAGLLSATLYRRLGRVLMQPFYAGCSIEYGNVFEKRDEISYDAGVLSGSLFLGIDTFIGPVYAAYGLSEGGRSNYYLFLGQSFNHWRAGLGER